MAKREAGAQLQKDRDEKSDDEVESKSLTASAEVMARRKVLKPRGRAFKSAGTDSKPNAFSGFGSTFSNVPKPQPTQSQPEVAYSLFASTISKAPSHDRNEKIKALNIKFIETLNRLNTPGTIVNFVPIAQKYISYYENIDKESLPTPQAQQNVLTPDLNPTPSAFSFGTTQKPDSLPTKPETKEPEIVDAKSDSDEESDDEVKIQGPQFTVTAKPSLKNTPFSFKPKPAKKPSSDSDSDDDIKIEGPTFTFNKEIKDKVFKFDQPKKSDTTTGSAFSFTPKPSEEPKADKPAFSFGASNDKPAFSFGASKPEEPKTSGFSFGSGSKTEESKPAFSFGSSTKPEEPKPSFSFGAAAKAEEPKPAFSFGSSNKTEEPKPLFSFGSSNKTEEPKTSFLFTSASKPEASKPTFAFGTSVANGSAATTDSAPSFSFNPKPQEKKDEEKASEPKENDKPNPFSFNAPKADDKPKPFSFNPSKSNEDAEKPKPFSFSSSNTPAFSFNGNGNGNDKTQGLFSKPEEKSTDTNSAAKPAFSFGLNSTSNNDSAPKPFSFGSASNGTAFGAASNGKGEPAEEPAAEEETGGDFKPIVDLTAEKVDSPHTGEEDEEVLYEKKAKLMLFEPTNKENPYTPKGLGELKVLKNKETSKSRILVRADGGLRVLLNTSISKDITYDTIGNGSLVRVPTVDPSDQSIKTYVLRVKTGADGEALLKSINEAK